MKICFFSGDITRSGGTERVALNIANALASRNDYEVHILSLEHETNELFFEVHPEIIVTSILKEVNGKSLKSKYLKIIHTVRKYVLEQKIDVLIDIDTILSLYSLPALIHTPVKHIAWEHFTYHQNLNVNYRDWGRKLASKFSHAIVVLTDRDHNNFSNNLNVNCPIYAIYNPMVEEASRIPAVYNAESKVILSAGRLTYQKGFDLLVDVAEKVFDKHPDWKWIVLGDGEEKEELQAKIQALNLSQNIFLKGNVKNIEDYYGEASMFVLTSRFEPFGLVLTEAKSFHLPCVSFDVEAGPSEIILNDVNGYLVEPFDLEAMAEKINHLIEQPDIRIEQAASALEDTEKFHLDTVLEKWEELFQTLLAERRVLL